MSKTIFPLLLILFSFPLQAQDAWKAQFIKDVGNGGVYVEDMNGRELFSYRADDSFIPASTIKVATTACALNYLGPDYRFTTDFYLSDGVLTVKGYGDPGITSEEMALIAHELKSRGLKSVTKIVLDNSYFAPNIKVDGSSNSSNPYDALNAALLVNFNTVNVTKLKNGKVQSGEKQTPLTPIAAEIGSKMKASTQRISLASNPDKALRYFGELLAAFLEKEGIKTTNDIVKGTAPTGNPFYTHRSTQTLADLSTKMLDYSTNLIANQIFIAAGAKMMGTPATVENGSYTCSTFLRDKVGLKNFTLIEGSGLSRNTRVTPREMAKLLKYFHPYQKLLPLKENLFLAKTGTLTGVNTFMGYLPLKNGGEGIFVILVNQQVPFNRKFELAKKLYRGLNGL